jgi:hypothetical protein
MAPLERTSFADDPNDAFVSATGAAEVHVHDDVSIKCRYDL